ncbi:MAG: type II toxin-antitoxin system RelE/ParE family toxin [Planctomycetaceae bacterium]
MPEVRKTPAAEETLLDIGIYIYQSSGSLEIALNELERIDAKARQYAHQPMMGTARPDLGENIRCFTVDSFVVIYEPSVDGITILLAIHGAQDVPRAFQNRFK